MNSFKLHFLILFAVLVQGLLAPSAEALQVRCPIVHRAEIMSEIRRLEQAKDTWENTPGSLNNMKLSLLQRMMTSGAIKNFDERVYNDHLLSLLLGQAKPSDANVLRYTEGKLAVLEFLNLQSNKLMSKESFLKDIEAAPAMRQRRAAKLLTKLDLQNGVTRRFLDDFSAEFFLATRGVPEKSLDFILKSSEERVHDTWAKLFQEQLMEKGLRRVSQEVPAFGLTRRQILTIKLKVFFRSTIPKILFNLPTALPEARDVRLSEDLMVKVALDGMSAHRVQIEKELAAQGNKSTYNRLRRLWTPLFAGALMFVTYPHVVDQMHKGVQEAVEVEIANQRAQARHDFKKGLEDAAVAGRFFQVQDIQQRTNRYMEMTGILAKKWGHRDWTVQEVEAVAERAYGNLLTSQIRADILGSLSNKVSEVEVYSVAQQIEQSIFISNDLIRQGEALP